MNPEARRRAAGRELSTARVMLADAETALNGCNVNEETVFFLLDRGQSAVSKCRSWMEKYMEDRDREKGESG